MEEITLTGQSISAFREFLVENEKARATVEKYVQEAEQLRLALCGAPVTKAGVLAYRERLQQQYRALTVNNKLSGCERVSAVLWSGALRGEVAEGSAAGVSGGAAGT